MSEGVKTKKTNRFMELEGLRGIAAIIVVIFHFLVVFYAGAFYGLDERAPVQHFRLEDNIYANPFAGLLSGAFAVSIFFVLSGFVLSIGYFQTGKSSIVKNLAAKRYIRLMLPALASIIAAYSVIVLGLSHTREVAAISQSIEGIQQWDLVPNIFEAIKGGIYGIFVEAGNPYNRVLWTMYTEFAGSFLIFGFLLLFGKSQYRWLLYGVLILLTYNNFFLAFILGMMFADLYSIGRLKQKKRSLLITSLLLLIGIFLGGYPDGSTENTIYATLTSISTGLISVPIHFFTIIGAAILLFAVLRSSQISHILRHERVSVLGKYTYSLYLVHMTVLYTFTTGLFLALHSSIGYNKAAILSILLSAPLVYGATVLFEKYIDKPSTRLSTHLADIFYGRREFSFSGSVRSAWDKLYLAGCRIKEIWNSRLKYRINDNEIE